jgi:CRISPR-associated protein (TIGR03984 family)
MPDFNGDFKSKTAEYFRNVKAWAVCTMYHGVCIGRWTGADFVFHESAEYSQDCVTELRVFNTDAELRFVKVGADYNVRYKDETEVSEDDRQESVYLLYGSRVKGDRENGWLCLSEERGGELWFPNDGNIKFDKIQVGDREEEQVLLWLKLHNYLKYNAIAVGADDRARQTGKPALEVTDYRYVDFLKGRKPDGTAKECVEEGVKL